MKPSNRALALALLALAASIQPATTSAQTGKTEEGGRRLEPSTIPPRLAQADAEEENELGSAPLRLPQVTIEELQPDPFERTTIDLDQIPATQPDPARLMRRVPGGNISDNGPLSSQVQYRGMFGPRMNVLVDGMYINSGGPNWMDPPLHYVPGPLLESMEVVRGIAPVSSGGEPFGGTVLAHTKRSHFTDGPAFKVSGDATLNGRTVDDGFAGGGILSIANDTHRLHVIGASEIGDDSAFGDGTIRATEHERHTFGAGYGTDLGTHEVSLNYRHTDTDDTGNPSLPMDIDFFDTDILRADYTGRLGAVALNGKVYYSEIDHRMNNFKLRPAPNFNPMTPGPDPRFVNARSDGIGYVFDATWTLAGGEMELGIDGHLADHDMVIRNPNIEDFFVTQFNKAERDRYGVYAEWLGALTPKTSLQLGLRYNRFEMGTGEVDAAPARRLPPPQRLRDAFNTADRDRSDNNFGWTIKLDHQLTDQLTLEAGVARRTRSPGYYQRYLWLPVEVTAGLGDGNNYVGKIGLDPEVSHQFELGFNWSSDDLRFSPRAYYRIVDDFIQGTPATDPDVVAVSTLNGDPTPLRFRNVEAEFFGVDLDTAYQISTLWRVNGVLSYVRGKRRDIDDALFRITPPNARLSLTRQTREWLAALEAIGYAEQDNISQTIVGNEPSTTNEATPGYVVFNFYGQWQPDHSRLTVTAGVNNLFDRAFTNHIAGFNRVQGSDVPTGKRLPGRGRNVFLRLKGRW